MGAICGGPDGPKVDVKIVVVLQSLARRAKALREANNRRLDWIFSQFRGEQHNITALGLKRPTSQGVDTGPEMFSEAELQQIR
jgi:hypothetical protein